MVKRMDDNYRNIYGCDKLNNRIEFALSLH